MLLKLDKFAEIGRFGSLRHKAPQFPKLALVYARNAQGKSTICAVLNSAATGNASMIGARRRLGSTAEPAASFEWGQATVTYSGGKWNICPGPLYVFDQEYVERNVHLAGSVTRANKRQLLQVVIGEQGIALAQEIEDLDAELKQLATEQAATSRVIQTAHKVVNSVESFCATPVPEDIEHRIERASRAVELARRAAAVVQRPELPKLHFSDLASYEALLATTMEGVSSAAAQQVAEHIDQHHMEPNGARWLKYGVDHMVGDACPFCTQDTRGVPFVAALQGYFSDAYAAHTSRIDERHHALNAVLGDEGGGENLRAILARARADVQFWSEVCELPPVPTMDEDFIGRAVAAVQGLWAALSRKLASPLARVTLGEDRDEIDRGLQGLRDLAAALDACEPAIARARAEATAADLQKAQQVLAGNQALLAKASDPIKAEVAAFTSREARKVEIARRKAALQQQLRAYVAETVISRQAEINRLLRLFGANFEITDTKASFVGREPNTEYCITIGQHAVKVGEESAGEPSFKTVLSAGDKFTLALAFFLTQVRANARLSDCAVVLDDPFSSQDMQRQFETANQVRALASAACQVIVLSHDPRFLQLIEKDAEPAICKTFQVSFEDDTTAAIKEWSSAEELKALYVRQAERIRTFANTGTFLRDGNAESLVKEIRPFVEEFIKQRFPGRFQPLDLLDAMANDIADAGSTDPLFKDVENLKALNEYTRRYHHGGAGAPDPGELRAQCHRVVDILGRY